VLIGLLLFVLFALVFTFKAETVRASPKDIWVPYDYTTIQAAINAADPGDVIHVASGTYAPAVVNKSLTLIAEGEAIIDGQGADDVNGFHVEANSVSIYNFKIQNGGEESRGIWLDGPTSCIVENNHIRNFARGISINGVFNSRVSNNTITHCKFESIYFSWSSDNYLVANTIYNSTGCGISLQLDSNFNVISDNNITITMIYSYADGIRLGICSNNTIYNNWINCSGFSITVDYQASNNLIYHNNFIGNDSVKFYPPTANNKWFLDWPVGGNFWSSHTSPDVKSGLYQNEPGSDGICDNYYTIAEGVIDAYPLMGPCNRFEVRFGPPIPSKQEISVISNSSISDFQMNTTQKTISFNVAGESGIGFCRVDVPNVIVSGLWQNNYKVLVNGQEPLYMRNWTSGATTYIYFQYQHSTKEVVIVPEFQSALIPILLMLSTIIISIKKLSHRKNNQPSFIFPFHLPDKHQSSC
jgi:parallel beta-helix repeat protein